MLNTLLAVLQEVNNVEGQFDFEQLCQAVVPSVCMFVFFVSTCESLIMQKKKKCFLNREADRRRLLALIAPEQKKWVEKLAAAVSSSEDPDAFESALGDACESCTLPLRPMDKKKEK